MVGGDTNDGGGSGVGSWRHEPWQWVRSWFVETGTRAEG